MVDVGNAGPAASVGGNAENEFVRRDAGLKIGDDMRALLVATADDEGALVKELRFVKRETTR